MVPKPSRGTVMPLMVLEEILTGSKLFSDFLSADFEFFAVSLAIGASRDTARRPLRKLRLCIARLFLIFRAVLVRLLLLLFHPKR